MRNNKWILTQYRLIVTLEFTAFFVGLSAFSLTVGAAIIEAVMGELPSIWDRLARLGYFGSFLLPLSVFSVLSKKRSIPLVPVVSKVFVLCLQMIALAAVLIFSTMSFHGWDSLGYEDDPAFFIAMPIAAGVLLMFWNSPSKK